MLAQPIKDIRLLQPVPNVNQATCSQTTTQYPSTTPGPNHAGQASSQDPQNNRGWQGSLKAIWFNPPALAVAAMAGCPGARQNSIWRSPRWRDSTICLENSNRHPHSKEVFPWCSKGIFCVSICTHHLLPRLQHRQELSSTFLAPSLQALQKNLFWDHGWTITSCRVHSSLFMDTVLISVIPCPMENTRFPHSAWEAALNKALQSLCWIKFFFSSDPSERSHCSPE